MHQIWICYVNVWISIFLLSLFCIRNPFQELSDAVRMRKMEVIATATKSACDAGVHEPLIGIKMLGTLKREFGIVLVSGEGIINRY